jgi:hypothetical protein
MESRLPAHVEVSALIRQVQAEGGFATVVKKGQREAGTILVILTEKGGNARVFERMPQLDGSRIWHCSKHEDAETKQEFSEYLDRRASQDADLWILELDIANGERFIGLPSTIS